MNKLERNEQTNQASAEPGKSRNGYVLAVGQPSDWIAQAASFGVLVGDERQLLQLGKVRVVNVGQNGDGELVVVLVAVPGRAGNMLGVPIEMYLRDTGGARPAKEGRAVVKQRRKAERHARKVGRQVSQTIVDDIPYERIYIGALGHDVPWDAVGVRIVPPRWLAHNYPTARNPVVDDDGYVTVEMPKLEPCNEPTCPACVSRKQRHQAMN